jgi:hypothetical protein
MGFEGQGKETGTLTLGQVRPIGVFQKVALAVSVAWV